MSQSETSMPAGTEADPLGRLRAWQRFHIKLIALYGGTSLAALAFVGWSFYRTAVDAEIGALQERLLAMATSLAESIDGDRVAAVPLESTEFSPYHLLLQRRFEEVAARDPDVETIYVLRPTAEPTKLRFLVDYAKDGDTAAPGEAYDAGELPVMLQGFARPAVEDRLYTDQYGPTLSGYAPVMDSAGRSVAIVGADVQASRIEILYHQVLRTVAGVFVLALAAVVVVSTLVARSVRKPLNRIIEAADSVARGHLDARVGMQRKDEFGVMSRHFDFMAQGLQEREFLRETFGRYVSEDVARTVLAQPGPIRLGGEERVVSVLFTDLAGYSTLSEQMPPPQVMEVLNRYLGEMSELVDAHNGCVIEFLGDGVLAVFGAPNYLPQHEEAAVRCALAMQGRLGELNRHWQRSEMAHYWRGRAGEGLQSRIGIHTGAVIAGNLGSPSRMKYSVIGDSVNVAARLEALCKELDRDLLISQAVYDHLPEDLTLRLEAAGVHHLRGRRQTIRVYATRQAGQTSTVSRLQVR